MNVLCQVIYALVQVRKNTHHATLHASIIMGAINVNVQMVITYSKEILLKVSHLEKRSLNALGRFEIFFQNLRQKKSVNMTEHKHSPAGYCLKS